MMKVKFSFDKMVSYWHKDNGAGVKVDGMPDMSHWHTDVDWLNESVIINSADEVQKALEDVLEKNYMPSSYLLIMDDGRVSFNVLEDREGMTLNDKEADRLHDSGEQVYLCDYSVYIEIQEVYEPTVTQLQQMLPNAEF